MGNIILHVTTNSITVHYKYMYDFTSHYNYYKLLMIENDMVPSRYNGYKQENVFKTSF